MIKVEESSDMQELIKYTHCPLCHDTKMTLIRNENCQNHKRWIAPLSTQMVWLSCNSCKHIFREGYYTPEALEILFKGTNPEQQVGYQIEKQRLVSARMIDKVIPYQNHGVWLDVGFGNGSLLFTACEYGFKPIGIDLREENVTKLQSYGITAYKVNLLHVDSDDPISVISMADVLEHIPYPKEALQKTFELLGNKGVLFLSLPNSESIIWKIRDAQNINYCWSEMEHYHNFSRTRLYSLLKECGFIPVKYGISERYGMGMEIVAIKK
ncbi:2-polyprenyl-3-methyl-5-hydroxy-6-metoxy-1 [Commensalibacter papalotli (ex Botero et al. 2024)]|uniref:2-polyprenyl-3-methyl-5-hydroxy-6-metoxy-1 n=2 Tax=Commensalibacter papalotli (ex Botero et al. 2024) TaxID=2972766 RepID=A0ABM9HPK1_9PROT|nr:2-polyprenyl-3-methyl-5-hydroxy-6-metoxy-1 [Commensalibacter papalotli (ex Botero et al. 2024)]CAI3943179.1 2-polyprenyl-3-methyl-5-hydroxy-6-metoxy-1 [Commensalibacter papalotli (ex Botero et al. 2024)]